MRRLNSTRRNYIILGLCIILLIMGVGYAAFQSQLKISGTSKVTSNWNIEITNVTSGTPTGTAENTVAPTWDSLTASMEADLYEKGDAMEYDITIENKGTVDAKLNDVITNLEKSNNEAVNINFSGYIKGEKLKAKESKIIHVKIEYNPNYQGGETSSEVEIKFDYVQNNNKTETPANTFLVKYDCLTNGGQDCSNNNEYLVTGSNADLTKKGTKDKYEFIGWNIDKDAKTGIKNISISNSDITLYAIYSKQLKVTYEKGSNVTSIGKESDVCTIYNNETLCEITLPTITANPGYTPVGWNKTNGETTGTASGSKLSINSDSTYYANAVDNIAPTTPTITNSSNENWTSENVIVTVKSTDAGSGIDHYEWYENNEWTTRALTTSNEVGTITFTADRNLNIQFRAIDKAGNISEVTTTLVKIDTKAPTLSISTTKTTNSITVVASASSASGISKYEYSKDGGKTWINGGSNKTHVFNGLTQGTNYNIAVRVTSNSGKQASTSKTTTTNLLSISFSVANSGTATNSTYEWAASKKVTVNFSETCGQNGITCSYTHTQSQGSYFPTNETVTVKNTKTASYNYNTIGTMVAKISNGTETKSATYTVTKIGNAATTLINKGIVSSGGGLYVDPYEASSTKDRFIYRGVGENVKNYALISGVSPNNPETVMDYFRIVAIESDGTLKIMRNNTLYTNLQWSSSTSHKWNNSTLRNYINTNFKSYLENKKNSSSNYFYSNHNWYYGDINYDANQSQTLNQTIQAEKSLTLSNNNSPFGVLNMSDYIKSSSNTTCKTVKDSRDGKCGNNWLWRDGEGILATPSTNGGNTQGAVVGWIGWNNSNGVPMSAAVKTEKLFNVRPAGYYVAHAYIISGTGTASNPYILSTY